MAKTVFSKTADVAREWAKGELAEARTGSNTSMRSGVLRSYGTAIAAIVLDANGNRVALVSDGQWSSGTSKVQGEARSAAKEQALPVFTVPNLSAGADQVRANLAGYQRQAETMLEKLRAGRPTSAASYRSRAADIIAVALEYARAFDTEWRWCGPDPETVRHPKEEG